MSNKNFSNRVYSEASLKLDLPLQKNITKYEIYLLFILKYINYSVARVLHDRFNIRLNSNFDSDYLKGKKHSQEFLKLYLR